MKIIKTTVFEFGELNDKAKEKAREWYRRACDGDNDFADCVIEDAQQCAELMGITFNTRPVKLMGGGTRQDACVFWSGFSSQGDGACFEGSWKASDVKTGKLKEHAPEDSELHRIAKDFEDVKHFYPDASFSVKHIGRYSHKGCTEFDFNFGDDSDDTSAESVNLAEVEKQLTEAARDFMQWIYRQLEKEYEYQNSDEQVDDTIQANEYTFTEDGKRF